jgi:hypothetical protein
MTLAELLVATTVTAAVAGAAFAAVMPLQRGFAAQPEAAGLVQRIRVVSELLASDVRHASLVLPFRIGDVANDIANGAFYRPDVVTLVTDSVDALASGLMTPSRSTTYHLKQDGEGVWQLMQYDGRASDQPAVEDVIALRFEYFGDGEPPVAVTTTHGDIRVTYGPVPPQPAVNSPNDSWGPGENCTIANDAGAQVSRLRNLGTGIVPIGEAILTDGPWCPDAGHAFRFDADLLRIRRVRVTVRLQAARPFRGLTGTVFAKAGNAGDPWRFVPDETVSLELAPRNINVAR